jgi:pyruvate/2-oxoglutarate dehydrogenase complex dihydrolipoamide acyltransferase (E2) component
MQLDCGVKASYGAGRITMATKKAAKKSTKKAAKKAPAKKSSSMRKYSPSASKDVEREMKAMKQGKLKSGRSGKTVTNPKQAIAIGLSEARKEGKKVPPAPKR